MIGSLVISSTPSAIVELVANSYDADAKEVHIDYDPRQSTLVVQDNGSGMTPEGLQAFYRLGDSPKISQPISPAGRTRIGKFGVATILLSYLAKEYTLRTEKDGIKTIASEVFEGKLMSDKEIPFRTTETSPETHGTQISMKRLNFEEGKEFSTKELKKKIQWELPLLPDFKVYLNEEQVEPKSISDAIQFKIDERGANMGKVNGDIYFTGHATKMNGIHIYVNGRRIGDPKSFIDTDNIKRGLVGRIVGVINADELESAILFDRGRFKEDHAGVIQLRESIGRALNEIRKYTEEATTTNNVKKIKSERPKLLQKVKGVFISAGVEGIRQETLFDLSEDIPDNDPGFYDRNSGSLLLNPNHPRLSISSSTKLLQYEDSILEAVVDTLAMTRARQSENNGDSLDNFLKAKAVLWAALTVNKSSGSGKNVMHPMVVYTYADLARHSGKSLGAIRYMAKGRLFAQNDEEVLGKEFLEAEQKTRGMVNLYDFLQKRNGQVNLLSQLDRFTGIFQKVGRNAEPFIRNLAQEGAEPCYFVEGSCTKKVETALKSESMDLRRVDADPAQEFKVLRANHYSLPELAKYSEGIDLREVSRIIDHANRNGLEIRQERSGGVKFNYGDFVKVLQHMRGNLNGKQQ